MTKRGAALFSRVKPTPIPADGVSPTRAWPYHQNRRKRLLRYEHPVGRTDRSQEATTERCIGRKPRKFRDKFEPMPRPERPFYNNDLWLAVQGVSSEPVSADFPVKQGKNREFSRI